MTYFIVTGLACYCRLEKPLQFYNQESDRWFASPDNATRYADSTEAEAVQFGSPGFLGSPIVISAEALASVLTVVRSHAEVKLEQSRRDVESGTTVLRNMSGTISFLESQ